MSLLNSNPVIASKIQELWQKFWSGGISNPLTAIEQITYLLFMKKLDDNDLENMANAEFTGDDYKEAYDHYLPKSKYPFTSMNFMNLFPMCTDCNSKEKGKDDIILKNGKKRIVSYPFDKHGVAKSLVIKPVNKNGIKVRSKLLKNIDWDFEISMAKSNDERVDSWNNIFGIKKRYKLRVSTLETIWFEWLIDGYKDSLDDRVLFSVFKKRKLKEVKKQILTTEKGIIKYSYK